MQWQRDAVEGSAPPGALLQATVWIAVGQGEEIDYEYEVRVRVRVRAPSTTHHPTTHHPTTGRTDASCSSSQPAVASSNLLERVSLDQGFGIDYHLGSD